MLEVFGAIAAVVICAWLVVRSERKSAQHLHDFFDRNQRPPK